MTMAATQKKQAFASPVLDLNCSSQSTSQTLDEGQLDLLRSKNWQFFLSLPLLDGAPTTWICTGAALLARACSSFNFWSSWLLPGSPGARPGLKGDANLPFPAVLEKPRRLGVIPSAFTGEASEDVLAFIGEANAMVPGFAGETNADMPGAAFAGVDDPADVFASEKAAGSLEPDATLNPVDRPGLSGEPA